MLGGQRIRARRDGGQSWGPPEEDVNWEMASLSPDAASEGGSQGAGAPVCTAAGAKEEQLINLILKQIYRIVSGFAGSRRKWFPGGRGPGGRRPPPLPCTQHLRAGPLTPCIPPSQPLLGKQNLQTRQGGRRPCWPGRGIILRHLSASSRRTSNLHGLISSFIFPTVLSALLRYDWQLKLKLGGGCLQWGN